MRTLILSAMMLATSLPAAPVLAQDHGAWTHGDVNGTGARDYRNDRRDDRRDRRDDRRDRRDDRRDARNDREQWRRYRDYDWNRVERGQRGYYAERYYRDGRYYQPVRVTRNTRFYRGGDGRYYCRRDDGTTGLIVGGAIGALLGNSLDRGNSSLVGTLIGGAGGALLGREVDRGGVSCR